MPESVTTPDPLICQNCGGTRKAVYSAMEGCQVYRCGRCHSLFAVFPPADEDRPPWDSPGVTETFLAALRKRREIQAETMLARFGEQLRGRRILDYACGQGIFSKIAIEKGFDLHGCDYQVDGTVERLIPADRLLSVETSWGWPESEAGFDTLVALDVLEHVPHVDRFLGTLEGHGVDRVLAKIPLCDGPGGLMARSLAACRKPGFLSTLLLVEDVSPHVHFFTAKGFVSLFERAGFRLVERLNVVEVGSELADRNRGPVGASSLLMKSAGTVLEKVSPMWADTAAFLFERA